MLQSEAFQQKVGQQKSQGDAQANDLINNSHSMGSWGGFDFQSTPIRGSGVDQSMGGPQGIGSEAQFILQGSSGAEAALRRGYEMMLREQAGNVAGAQLEDTRRTGAQLTSSGVSPLLASLISRQRTTQAQGEYGGAVGGAGASFQNNLATLEKGTGSELAGVRQYDIGLLLNARAQRAATVAAEQSGLSKLAGVAIGAAGAAGGLGWQPFK